MLFSLEAIEAKHGDALLLHWGKTSDPQLAIIDGGPSGVWTRMQRRLEALRNSRVGDGNSLPVPLMMVSHIDDDHIRGVLDCTDHLIDEDDNGDTMLLDITRLWHNSFADVAGGAAESSMAAVAGPAATAATGSGALHGFSSREAAAVVASIDQGKRLRANARNLQLQLNPGFAKLVQAGGAAKKVAGLSLKVIGPATAQLAALEKKWKAAKKKADSAGTAAAAQAIIAAYVDESVANLSSIVVLASHGGKQMLLTGDARGDHILAGLKTAKLLKNGKLHVDLLKVMHHGSEHNAETEFFETVTADHYVISADGKHDNPDVAMLKMLVAARGQDRYTIHLTNRVTPAAAYLTKAAKTRKFKVVYRSGAADSLVVDLGDSLPD